MKKGCVNSKKSQVTLFIIIAIVIVVLIGGLAYVYRDKIKNYLSPRTEVEIKDNLEKCLKERLYESVYLIGLQGGYYEIPPQNVNYMTSDLPIYYDQGKLYLPSKDKISEEIGKSIEADFGLCLLNLADYTERGYKINVRDIASSSVKMNNKMVSVVIEVPITITQKEETKTISKLNSEIKFDFEEKYNAMLEAIEIQKSKPQDLIFFIPESPGKFNIESIEIEENIILYSLVFPEEIYDTREFLYSFVTKI